MAVYADGAETAAQDAEDVQNTEEPEDGGKQAGTEGTQPLENVDVPEKDGDIEKADVTEQDGGDGAGNGAGKESGEGDGAPDAENPEKKDGDGKEDAEENPDAGEGKPEESGEAPDSEAEQADGESIEEASDEDDMEESGEEADGEEPIELYSLEDETEGTYTDGAGISFTYTVAEDGTAVADYSGKDLAIPAEIDGHAVTRVEGNSFGYGSRLSSLIIPETVEYIGEDAFSGVAVESDVVLSAKEIAAGAFDSASFQKLTLAGGVGTLCANAFKNASIKHLQYDTTAVHGCTDRDGSVFYLADIYALDFGSAVTELPDYAFSRAKFRFGELTVNIKSIGDYAFERVWSSGVKGSRLVITDGVEYIGAGAFSGVKVQKVEYNASASSNAAESAQGAFYLSEIGSLAIGGGVRLIGDYMFSHAEINQETLTVNAEAIGRGAFYYGTQVTDLTIGEDVKSIGTNAFWADKIENLHYYAVNAEVGGGGRLDTKYAPFWNVSFGSVEFGGGVEHVPGYLLCLTSFAAEKRLLPESVKSVGPYAFYAKNLGDITLGELSLEENIKSVGVCAFAGNRIGSLVYGAGERTVQGLRYVGSGPFSGAEIVSFEIRDGVEEIPGYMFDGAAVLPREITIPDSVKRIGASAFCNLSPAKPYASSGTLTVGAGVEYIAQDAFHQCSFDLAVVKPLKADDVFKGEDEGDFYLPYCSTVEIHRGSDFYGYFTRKADLVAVDLKCGDFEREQGEEYFDGERGCFATPYTDTCTVCGYGTQGETTQEALFVTFVDYDGTRLARIPVKEGEGADAPENPERAGYRFVGWDKAFNNVTEDTTVTAEYEALKFTVTFRDGDKVLDRQEVEYGKDAEKPKDPTRPGGEWGSWVFVGWDKGYTGITDDVTLYAVFEKELNTYTVIFLDAEGNELDRQTVEHGSGAQAPKTPEKKADAQYEYAFTGWDADFAVVKSDMEVSPQYTAKVRSYTVTFLDAEGGALESQTVEYGSGAREPDVPGKASTARHEYIPKGWDKDVTNVTGDMTVRPVYEEKTRRYTVTFMDGGMVLDEQEVEYGKNAKKPKDPTRPGGEWGSWVFVGWDKGYTGITDDVTVYATFEKQLNVYTVIFLDAEGNVLKKQEVEHGKDAQTPDAPGKASTAQYEYIFSGWSADFTAVKSDMEISPQYTSKIRRYIVTFLDAEEGLIKSESVEYGGSAQTPDAPGKASTAQHDYIFAGWDGDVSNVKGDMTVRPVYKAQLRRYAVTFMDGDTVIDEQDVEYGGDAQMPETPARPEEEWGVWRFVEWAGNFLGVTKNETVRAVFEKVLNRYAVTFLNADGKVYVTRFVEHGSAAQAPDAPPEKEPTAAIQYVFTGWDGSLENITGTTVLRPVYEERTRRYAVIFLNAYGGILSMQSVEYGGDAASPGQPEKKEDAWNTYVFTGWDGSYKNVQADMTLRPVYNAERKHYTVDFMDGETVLSTQEVEAGGSAQAPEMPQKRTQGGEEYAFAGWSVDYGCILSNTIVRARYEKIAAEDNGKPSGTGGGTQGNNGKKPQEPGNAGTGDKGKDVEETEDAPETEENGAEETGEGGTPPVIAQKDETQNTGNGPMVGTGRENPGRAERTEDHGITAETDAERETCGSEVETAEDSESGEEDALEGADTETGAEAENAVPDRGSLPWGVFAALGAVFASLAVSAYFAAAYLNRREVSGTVRGKDGKPSAGLSVLLEGIDSCYGNRWSADVYVETRTDKDGRYSFGSIPMGRYHVSFPGMAGEESPCFDVSLKDIGKDASELSAHGCGVQAKKEGKKCTIDVTV